MKNCIYTSSQHADTETQAQAKFFDKLTLNAYRKAIANRYGFKSYKLFKDALDEQNNVTVYVVAYEQIGSSGGYDWFYDKEDALSDFENEKEMTLTHNQQLFFFEVTLPKDEDVNDYLEGIYTELSDKAEMMFPYPKDVWQEIIGKYNATGEIETISQLSALKLNEMRKAMLKMFSDKRIADNTNDPEAIKNKDTSIEEFVDIYTNLGYIDNRIIDNITNQETKLNNDLKGAIVI